MNKRFSEEQIIRILGKAARHGMLPLAADTDGMQVRDQISKILVRLPMWIGLESRNVVLIADLIIETSLK